MLHAQMLRPLGPVKTHRFSILGFRLDKNKRHSVFLCTDLQFTDEGTRNSLPPVFFIDSQIIQVYLFLFF